MTERLVREPAAQRVSQDGRRATRPASRIRLDDSALDHRPIPLKMLPDGLETELVEAAERGGAGRSEASVEHVEVFQT